MCYKRTIGHPHFPPPSPLYSPTLVTNPATPPLILIRALQAVEQAAYVTKRHPEVIEIFGDFKWQWALELVLEVASVQRVVHEDGSFRKSRVE